MNKRPIAVLISDIHYNLQTLPLADASLRQAINTANELEVPLIIAGDLHDTKANLRGECVKAMIETISLANMPPIILRGNHDQINEKSIEHSLEFLKPFASIITYPIKNMIPYWTMIPYHHDVEELRAYLKTLPLNTNIIMHQGIQGSNSGEYFQDPSALTHADVKDFRVVSGHYHTRQTINTGTGIFDYIGNPYTLTFGEAGDPEKGYQILTEDGTLEFVPTNLRKHIKIDIKVGDIDRPDLWQYNYQKSDLLWVRISGDHEHLLRLTKSKIAAAMEIDEDFRLDLIPTDSAIEVPNITNNSEELLDSIIDNTDYSNDRKVGLKELWRRLRG